MHGASFKEYNMVQMTLLQALRKAGIDKKEGQLLPQFAAELKALTDADRQWFKERFAIEFGWEIVASL
jgi:hypothetical protein